MCRVMERNDSLRYRKISFKSFAAKLYSILRCFCFTEPDSILVVDRSQNQLNIFTPGEQQCSQQALDGWVSFMIFPCNMIAHKVATIQVACSPMLVKSA